MGPALPGVEVRIAGDQEILTKGPNVFMGYYKVYKKINKERKSRNHIYFIFINILM